MKQRSDKQELKFCVNATWMSLHPGKQSSLIGALVITQQFESLVKMSWDGNVLPSIASDWKISDDFKKIKFTLDQKKTFHDGSPITAQDVFNSWKNSLNIAPDSFNNSLKDVLYMIEGFDAKKNIAEIPGFKIISPFEFELIFKRSFRMGIYHLKGARFSIYKIRNEELIGSGHFRYNINDSESSIVRIENSAAKFQLSFSDSTEVLSKIMNNECDFAYILKANQIIKETQQDMGFKIIKNSTNEEITLNNKSWLFKDKSMRQAFQYLVYTTPGAMETLLGNMEFAEVDIQIYPPLASGRINRDEEMKIITEGKVYLEEFMNRIKSKKIIYAGSDVKVVQKLFEVLSLGEYLETHSLSRKENLEMLYKEQYFADFTIGSYSIISGDPDGIYHAYGRNGAILFPMTANEKIFDLLELGRNLTDLKEIDTKYQEVTRTFLYEVPSIHLGRAASAIIFNPEKVNIKNDSYKNSFQLFDIEAM